ARDAQRRQACHVPLEVRYHTRQDQCLEMLDLWGNQVPHGWVTGDDELGRHTRFRGELRARGERYVLGVPCNTTMRDLEAPGPAYQGRGRRPKAPWHSVSAWRQSLEPAAWTRLTVREGENRPGRNWRWASKRACALKPASKEGRVRRAWTNIRCAPGRAGITTWRCR